MTAHELAKKLLEGPDLPVSYQDWDRESADNPDIEVDFIQEKDGKVTSFGGFNRQIPHIHLS